MKSATSVIAGMEILLEILINGIFGAADAGTIANSPN
jgi:hypothetical protein